MIFDCIITLHYEFEPLGYFEFLEQVSQVSRNITNITNFNGTKLSTVLITRGLVHQIVKIKQLHFIPRSLINCTGASSVTKCRILFTR